MFTRKYKYENCLRKRNTLTSLQPSFSHRSQQSDRTEEGGLQTHPHSSGSQSSWIMNCYCELFAAGAVHRAHRSRERTGLFRRISTPFTVNAFNKEACVHLFRFDHDCIALIASRVLPCTLLRLENRCVVPRIEAMCILLHTFCYPNRLECYGGIVWASVYCSVSRCIRNGTEPLFFLPTPIASFIIHDNKRIVAKLDGCNTNCSEVLTL
jgi:hypothetical protein